MTDAKVLLERAAGILRECSRSPEGVCVVMLLTAAISACSQEPRRTDNETGDLEPSEDRLKRICLEAAQVLHPLCERCGIDVSRAPSEPLPSQEWIDKQSQPTANGEQT